MAFRNERMKPEEIKGAVKTRGKLPAKSRFDMGDIRLWLYLSYAAVWFDFGFEIRLHRNFLV